MYEVIRWGAPDTEMQILKPLLGSGASIPIDFGPLHVEQLILPGSDSLFKYVKHQDIKLLLSPHLNTMEITDLAKKETGSLQDDFSARNICWDRHSLKYKSN